jgi:TRAP-type C4-dicarboxylate transport system permease large subunit
MMLFLLVVGTAMDLTPTILIFGPVCAPLAVKAGIDPVYFGFMFVLNVGIGVITPPVGTVLFVVCGSAGISMSYLVRKMAPFLIMEIAVLFLLLFFPSLSLVPLKWLM